MKTGVLQLFRGSSSGATTNNVKITTVRRLLHVGTANVQQQKQSSGETPVLPGLSQEQIRKIGEMDNTLRTRHMQIEADLTPSERDHARVSTEKKKRQCGYSSKKFTSSLHPLSHTCSLYLHSERE